VAYLYEVLAIREGKDEMARTYLKIGSDKDLPDGCNNLENLESKPS
jgi:hypothetical protein